MYVRVLQDELKFPDGGAIDQDTKSLIRGVRYVLPSDVNLAPIFLHDVHAIPTIYNLLTTYDFALDFAETGINNISVRSHTLANNTTSNSITSTYDNVHTNNPDNVT